jgi:hypothetical protein
MTPNADSPSCNATLPERQQPLFSRATRTFIPLPGAPPAPVAAGHGGPAAARQLRGRIPRALLRLSLRPRRGARGRQRRPPVPPRPQPRRRRRGLRRRRAGELPLELSGRAGMRLSVRTGASLTFGCWCSFAGPGLRPARGSLPAGVHRRQRHAADEPAPRTAAARPVLRPR